MTDETRQSHQGGNAADAQTGGGPSTERGGRDAGMPGPASGAGASSEATGGSEHYADSTETEATGTGSNDVAPTHSATEEATSAVTDPGPTSRADRSERPPGPEKGPGAAVGTAQRP